MRVAQVQIQLSSDLVAGLNRQLKHNQQLQNQVTLLTLNGSILPDATVFLPTAIAAAATAKVSASQPCSGHSCALQHKSSVQLSPQPPSQQGTTQQGLHNEEMHAQSQHDEALGLQDPCQPNTNWQIGNLKAKCAQTAHQLLPALCVEIKPKWGLLPTSPAIAAKHVIKKQVSRFQLQQHLKLAQGKISSISAYDPLDLFSGETVRMHRTLVALIANPQNNLKLFVDGKPVDTLDHTAQLDSTESLVEKAFGLDSDFAEPGNAVTLLADVLKHILLREGVLQKLLSIQALDAHDIEGIYPLYCHMLQQLRLQTDGPNVVHRQTPFEGVGSECELSALQPQKAHVMSLVRKTWSEQISMIRDYLLATTAKDCSLMITMQALPAAASPDHMESQCHCSHFSEFQKGFDLVSVPKIAVQLKYKVAVVDLDVKPHSKILSHYCLDQEIIKHQAMERLIMSDAAC
ncbi:TPA: Inositol-pentakisphosphate 2-kinase [Trebouxia sp. C0004]